MGAIPGHPPTSFVTWQPHAYLNYEKKAIGKSFLTQQMAVTYLSFRNPILPLTMVKMCPLLFSLPLQNSLSHSLSLAPLLLCFHHRCRLFSCTKRLALKWQAIK